MGEVAQEQLNSLIDALFRDRYRTQHFHEFQVGYLHALLALNAVLVASLSAGYFRYGWAGGAATFAVLAINNFYRSFRAFKLWRTSRDRRFGGLEVVVQQPNQEGQS